MTFAANVLADQDFPVVYEDLAAFKAAVAGRDLSDVRNMLAYHTPIMCQRGPMNARRYWESSTEWPPRVTGTIEMPFNDCCNFFLGDSDRDSAK